MSSPRYIEIHQDIFNYERVRRGFTERQWLYFAGAAVASIGIAIMFGYVLRLGGIVAFVLGVIAAAPFVAAAFFKPYNMVLEEFLSRKLDIDKRGNIFVFEGEECPNFAGSVSRAYKKEMKKRDFESKSHL